MGYSHYWVNKTFVIDEEMVADVEEILAAADVAIAGALGEAGSKPELKRGLISLNAEKPYSGETLRLEGKAGEDDKPLHDFCKTCNPGYDAVVTAILIRVAETNPDAKIRSDGTFGEDWRAGRELFERSLGRAAVCPKDVSLRCEEYQDRLDRPAYVNELGRGGCDVYAPHDPRCPRSGSRTLSFASKGEAAQWLAQGGYVSTTAKVAEARLLWSELGDVCVDDDGCIDDDWHDWPAGTDREDIWRDIEEQYGRYGVTIAKLMAE